MSATDMIAIQLSRVKDGKPWKDSLKVFGYSPPPAPASSYAVGMTAEDNRRDEIIRNLLIGNTLMIGLRVRPANDEDFAKNGTARILTIARSYAAYRTPNQKEDDWPENDNPYIVHARYEKPGGEVVHATINYFIPYVESTDANQTGKSC